MVKNVAFDKKQIAYLDKYLSEGRTNLLKEVNKESFDGSEKAISGLCDRFFNVSDLKSSKSSKSLKRTKKRKLSGYFKWLHKEGGMNEIKTAHPNLEQKNLLKEAGKKWSAMSEGEKNKYK